MRGLVSNKSAVEAPHKRLNLELRPYQRGRVCPYLYPVGVGVQGHCDTDVPKQMLDQIGAKLTVHLLIALVA